MAADPLDLTDLGACRELLQTPDAVTVNDELLQTLITEASVMLQRALGRKFTPEDAATKSFEFWGGGLVSLATEDLRSFTAITFTDAGSSTPVTIAAGRVTLAPISAPDGVYNTVMLLDYANTRAAGQTVTITGDWGFDEIPYDVARGCKITVKTWLREGAMFNPDGNLIRFERVGRVPQDVLDGLGHYRAVLVA